jgi:hypothetical protein
MGTIHTLNHAAIVIGAGAVRNLWFAQMGFCVLWYATLSQWVNPDVSRERIAFIFKRHGVQEELFLDLFL